MSLNRFVCLVLPLSFGAAGFGCRGEPSVGRGEGAAPSASQHARDELATTQRCGPGFSGQMSIPHAKVIQQLTAQTKKCEADDCEYKTLGMLQPRRFHAGSCDEIAKNIKEDPIVDVWGAQARVTCNEHLAEAISAGRDGKLFTCDDLGAFVSLKPPRHERRR